MKQCSTRNGSNSKNSYFLNNYAAYSFRFGHADVMVHYAQVLHVHTLASGISVHSVFEVAVVQYAQLAGGHAAILLCWVLHAEKITDQHGTRL